MKRIGWPCCMHKQAARKLTENDGEYDSDGEEPDGDDIPRSYSESRKVRS